MSKLRAGDRTLWAMLLAEEGFRAAPYRDSKGFWTIGVGSLISAVKPEDWAKALSMQTTHGVGISREQAKVLAMSKVRDALAFLEDYTWWEKLTLRRQRVCVSMVYQMGPAGFRKFKRTLQYIRASKYDLAADEMLDSQWARTDSPARAERHAEDMRRG